jgi:Cu2+-exporting ATPase
MPNTYCFSLPGIRCVNCIGPLEDALRECRYPVIEKFAVELIDKKLTVIVTDDGSSLIEVRQLLHALLDEVGIEFVDIDLPAAPTVSNQWFSVLKKILSSHWFFGFLGTAAGITLLTLSLTMGGLPLAANIVIAAISVPLTLFLGAQSYKEAFKKFFKTFTLTMDTLFTMSTFTVIAVSIASFFFSWLPMMFDAGLLIFGFRHIGFGIEESIKSAIGLNVKFKDRIPRTVDARVGDMSSKRLLDEIQPGDLLLINPGEIIPVDGICELDNGLIVETIVTGSTIPRHIDKGETLLAGMYVAANGQPLTMRVTADVRTSYLARLDESIARANYEKAPLETATNKILQYFIPVVVFLAILSVVVISAFFPIAVAIKCAVSVLVSACPCTLGFITPLAIKIGMKKAADEGVQFKSAKTLQEADEIDRVVFDLNGTLTLGTPEVCSFEVTPNAGLTKDDLLAYFAALEKDSTHPMARAICEFAHEKKIDPPDAWQVTLPQTFNHSGLTACIDEETYTLGNQNMMNEAGIDTDELQRSLNLADGVNVVYLARAGSVIGYMLLQDRLRPDARHAVDSLKLLGKQVYLCTGADEATAHRYGRMLGVSQDNIRAGCIGAAVQSSDRDKKSYIDQLKQGGHRVAMVGDAANDALAITTSHFGIAVKSRGGDEMTQQQAGAVIQSGSLLPVVSAFAVAKQTVSNIKKNLLLSLGYNITVVLVAGGLLLAAGVMLNPGIGVALMILQTSLILYSISRFKQQKLAHLQDIPSPETYPTGSYGRVTASMPSPGARPQREFTANGATLQDASQPLPLRYAKQPREQSTEPWVASHLAMTDSADDLGLVRLPVVS